MQANSPYELKRVMKQIKFVAEKKERKKNKNKKNKNNIFSYLLASPN